MTWAVWMEEGWAVWMEGQLSAGEKKNTVKQLCSLRTGILQIVDWLGVFCWVNDTLPQMVGAVP